MIDVGALANEVVSSMMFCRVLTSVGTCWSKSAPH